MVQTVDVVLAIIASWSTLWGFIFVPFFGAKKSPTTSLFLNVPSNFKMIAFVTVKLRSYVGDIY